MHDSHREPWKLFKCVLPQHTDHAGVMWHGAYLAWLEEARIDALFEAGLQYSLLSSLGYEMPVVNLEIRFLQSILHGEKVVLESWLMPPKGLRLPWKTIFIRSDGVKAAEATVNLVVIRREGSNQRVLRHYPDQLKSSLGKLQLGPFAMK